MEHAKFKLEVFDRLFCILHFDFCNWTYYHSILLWGTYHSRKL
jgi:hypothetical protein